MKQRMAQICLTTAELALHYGGLGAVSPTSEVQEVKRLHCLQMQIVLLLPCLPIQNLPCFFAWKISLPRASKTEKAANSFPLSVVMLQKTSGNRSSYSDINCSMAAAIPKGCDRENSIRLTRKKNLPKETSQRCTSGRFFTSYQSK